MALGRKLYRSRSNRMIAGVCGGLADYTKLDPAIWRVIFVLAALPGGVPGILPYLLMWLFVPGEPRHSIDV